MIFLRLQDKAGSVAEKLGQVDWVGTVIFVASVTSFLIPITWVRLRFLTSSQLCWDTLPIRQGDVGISCSSVPKHPSLLISTIY